MSASPASTEPSLDRLRWQCRRGMLELDLLLTTFLEQRFASLTQREKACFQRLLDQPDPRLLAWFMGQEAPAHQELVELIEQMQRLMSAQAER